MLLSTNRFAEGLDWTASTFKTEDNKVKGYFLEPAGPDEIRSGLDKRIPVGLFYSEHHSTIKFPNNIIIFNNIVSINRGILVHIGNRGKDTLDCLLTGSKFELNKVIQSKDKFDELMLWYNAQPKGSVIFDIRSSIKI